MANSQTSPIIELKSVVIRQDRIVVIVQVNPAHAYTSPELAKQILADFSDITAHACINSKGPTFSYVIEHTSIPHLLEHLIIDLQASEYTINEYASMQMNSENPQTNPQADQQANSRTNSQTNLHANLPTNLRTNPQKNLQTNSRSHPLLTGVTRWIDESQGIAQVQVKMISDISALRALKIASEYLNGLKRET